MELFCGHCNSWFKVHDPYALPPKFPEPEFPCPNCGKTLYLEIDEGEDGPIFTALTQPI